MIVAYWRPSTKHSSLTKAAILVYNIVRDEKQTSGN